MKRIRAYGRNAFGNDDARHRAAIIESPAPDFRHVVPDHDPCQLTARKGRIGDRNDRFSAIGVPDLDVSLRRARAGDFIGGAVRDKGIYEPRFGFLDKGNGLRPVGIRVSVPVPQRFDAKLVFPRL